MSKWSTVWPDRTHRKEMGKLDMSPTCCTITMSVMVSVTVLKWELFFTKPRVKTNRQHCWDILLPQQTLKAMECATDGNFIFQQEGALTLIAFNTVQTLYPTSSIAGLWPQNGQELNSNDDEIYGATQQHEHELWGTRLNKLNQWPVKVWQSTDTACERKDAIFAF